MSNDDEASSITSYEEETDNSAHSEVDMEVLDEENEDEHQEKVDQRKTMRNPKKMSNDDEASSITSYEEETDNSAHSEVDIEVFDEENEDERKEKEDQRKRIDDLLKNRHVIDKITRLRDKHTRKMSKRKNKTVVAAEVKELREFTPDAIKRFIVQLQEAGQCYEARRKKFTRCTCITKLELEKTASMLWDFCDEDKGMRETALIGLLRLKFKNRTYLQCGPDEDVLVKVCQQTMKNLFGQGHKKFQRILKAAQAGNLFNEKHGLIGNTNMKKMNTEMKEDLRNFFSMLRDNEAEPRATRVVRETTLVALRDSEVDLVDLPSHYTKRHLYGRYCFERGYICKVRSSGAYGKMSNFDPRPNYTTVDGVEQEDERWPIGSKPKDITSWWSFRQIWKKEFPNLKIRPPSMDICAECTIFVQRQKYALRGIRVQKESDNESDNESETSNDEAPSPLIGVDDEEPQLLCGVDVPLCHDEAPPPTKDDNVFAEVAEIVKEAGEHVLDYQSMRDWARSRSVVAQQDRLNGVHHSQRHYVFVLDFSQNLELPHFGDEQPGETYYYSPLAVYIFGIADVSFQPTRMTAFAFHEGEGGKGGNYVASMIMEFLKSQDLLRNDCCGASLTVIMDNCPGQNKNHHVLHLPLLLTEANYFQEVTFAFYIKGHTKNPCDRMFKLLKMNYHKRRVFTMDQLLSIVNENDGVTVTHPNPNVFKDWYAYQSDYYGTMIPGTLASNHIYKATRDQRGTLFIKASARAPDPTQGQNLRSNKLKLIDCKRTERMLQLQPTALVPPGIPDLKANGLYKNYRPFVPEEYKDIICPRPSDDAIGAILQKQREKARERYQKKKQKKKGGAERDTNQGEEMVGATKGATKTTEKTLKKRSGGAKKDTADVENLGGTKKDTGKTRKKRAAGAKRDTTGENKEVEEAKEDTMEGEQKMEEAKGDTVEEEQKVEEAKGDTTPGPPDRIITMSSGERVLESELDKEYKDIAQRVRAEGGGGREIREAILQSNEKRNQKKVEEAMQTRSQVKGKKRNDNVDDKKEGKGTRIRKKPKRYQEE